jgi:hypothetical protein
MSAEIKTLKASSNPSEEAIVEFVPDGWVLRVFAGRGSRTEVEASV